MENEVTSDELSNSELLAKIVNDLEHMYDDLSDLQPSKDGEYSEIQVRKIVERTLGCAMIFGTESDKQQYAEHIMELEQGPQMCLMQCIQVRSQQHIDLDHNLSKNSQDLNPIFVYKDLV